MPTTTTELVDSIYSVISGQGAYKSSAQAGYSALQANNAAAAALASTVGDNAEIISRAKTSGELATQAAADKAGATFGVDLRQQNEVLSHLTEQMNSAYEERSAASQEIAAKKSVGFFDDPLQHVMNLLTINDDIDKHNAADRVYEETGQQIQRLNQLAQSTIQTQKALQASTTLASAKAEADNAKAAATQAQYKIANEGIIYNLDALKSAQDSDLKTIQLRAEAKAAFDRDEQLRLQREAANQSQERFNWEKLVHQQGEDADRAMFERLQQGIKNRLGAAYVPVPWGGETSRKMLAELKLQGTQAKADYESGARSLEIDPTGNTRIVAGSAAQAAQAVLGNNAPTRLSEAQAPIRQVLLRAAAEINSGKAKMPGAQEGVYVNRAKRDEVDAYMNQRVPELIKEQASNIDYRDENNLFNVGSVTDIVKSHPALQNLPAVQAVIAPAMAAGVDLHDPSKVVTMLWDASLGDSKKITPEQANQAIKLIYAAGAQSNMAARQLEAFGLSLTPRDSKDVKSLDYRTNVKIGGGFFGVSTPTPMNLVDDLDLARNQGKYFAQKLVNAVANQSAVTWGAF